MPAARLSRSESRELTRRRLLDAARAAFAARGFEGASLQEIQEIAGVSVGSFYHQFKDKADLFLAVLGELTLAVHRTLRELHAAPAGESLGALARRSLRRRSITTAVTASVASAARMAASVPPDSVTVSAPVDTKLCGAPATSV